MTKSFIYIIILGSCWFTEAMDTEILATIGHPVVIARSSNDSSSLSFTKFLKPRPNSDYTIRTAPCSRKPGGGGLGNLTYVTFSGCNVFRNCNNDVNTVYNGSIAFIPDKIYTSLELTVRAYLVNAHWNASMDIATLETIPFNRTFLGNTTEAVNYQLQFSTGRYNYKSGKYEIELQLASSVNASDVVICRQFALNLKGNSKASRIVIFSILLLAVQQIFVLLAK